MSPQRYSMAKRAEKMAATRQRIVAAATDLYRRQGIRATTLQQVADAADVAPTTILNHFGGLDGLAADVIDSIFESLDFPTEAIFAGAEGVTERVGRLVSHLFEFYARSSVWYLAFRSELGQVPAVIAGERRFEDQVGRLYEAALGSWLDDPTLRFAVMTLTGPSVPTELERAGLGHADGAQLVAGMLTRLLQERERQTAE